MIVTTGLQVDISQVSVKITFDVPAEFSLYMTAHGYSGRLGRRDFRPNRQMAISFVTTDEFRWLRAVQEYFSTSIEELPMDFADYCLDFADLL